MCGIIAVLRRPSDRTAPLSSTIIETLEEARLRLADAVDTLVATLTGHLTHEEKDGLPLIGVALTAAEWRGVGFKIARRNGLSAGGEMFSWMLSSATPDEARAVTRQLPPPVRVLYKAAWKPRFEKTKRW